MNRERNQVADFCRLVKAAVGGGSTLPRAVALVRTREPELALTVLEEIGSYPNSEPELAELQRQWVGR